MESIMKEWFNTEEAAEFLCLSPRTLKNWRSIGNGPQFVKLTPKAVRYSKKALDAFINDKPKGFVSWKEAKK